MADYYDSPWKEAITRYFEPFVAFFLPQAHREIDWSRGHEFLDKELQQITPEGELGARVVDKLVKVWLLSGEEEWLLIHVEVQMTEQGIFPLRVYVYNYRAFDLYNKEVVSVAVLGDENPRWRPNTFGYSRWGFRAEIQFPVVKLWDYVDRLDELESHPNPFAMVVIAHLRTLQTRQDDSERQATKIKLIKGLYDRGLSADEVRQLFRLIDWLMDLPGPLQTVFWNEVRRYEETKHMPFMTTPERLGLRQGRLEAIEAILRLRFGQQGLLLMPEVQKIYDPQRLQSILQAAETVARLEDLREMWADGAS
jgi:hypothetical protein